MKVYLAITSTRDIGDLIPGSVQDVGSEFDKVVAQECYRDSCCRFNKKITNNKI